MDKISHRPISQAMQSKVNSFLKYKVQMNTDGVYGQNLYRVIKKLSVQLMITVKKSMQKYFKQFQSLTMIT
jgi:hypothetical protein